MGQYEIQVLNNYENPTYSNGQVKVSVQTIHSIGKCLPPARRMADLRYRFMIFKIWKKMDR